MTILTNKIEEYEEIFVYASVAVCPRICGV